MLTARSFFFSSDGLGSVDRQYGGTCGKLEGMTTQPPRNVDTVPPMGPGQADRGHDMSGQQKDTEVRVGASGAMGISPDGYFAKKLSEGDPRTSASAGPSGTTGPSSAPR